MSNAMTRSTIIKRTPSPSPSLTGIVFLGKLLSVNRIASLTHLGLILYRMSYLQACYQTPHRSLPLLTIVWFIVFFRRNQSDAIAQDPESEPWLLIGPQAIINHMIFDKLYQSTNSETAMLSNHNQPHHRPPGNHQLLLLLAELVQAGIWNFSHLGLCLHLHWSNNSHIQELQNPNSSSNSCITDCSSVPRRPAWLLLAGLPGWLVEKTGCGKELCS